MKLKKKVTGTKKSSSVTKVRKLKAPETQTKRGRDGGNAKFQALSDDYEPEFEPKRIPIHEKHTAKGGRTQLYLEIKVQRFDEEGLPYVFMQMYQKSEKEEGYTGYLKGKTVFFPLEFMYEVLDGLTEVSDTCDRLKIE